MKNIKNSIVFWINGEKGGCGKSPTSAFILDYIFCEIFKQNENDFKNNVILIDTDLNNPDVGLAYEKLLGDNCISIDLKSKQGLEALLRKILENEKKIIVINPKGSDLNEIKGYSQISVLNYAMNTLINKKFQIHFFWVLAPIESSIKNFLSLINSFPKAQFNAILSEPKFEEGYIDMDDFIKTFEIAKILNDTEKGGVIIKLLTFDGIFYENFYIKHLPIHKVAQNDPLIEFGILPALREPFKKGLDEIFFNQILINTDSK